MTSNIEIVKEILLEDYRYRAEALKNSEESGETRFNIFVGLATLVSAALVTLGTSEHGPKGMILRLIVVGALGALLLVGYMMLMRLLIRNERTDECKRDLDHIRQTFKDHFDDSGMLVGYYPVNPPKYQNDRAKQDYCSSSLSKELKRRFGGMAHLMAMVNSMLLTGLVLTLVLPDERVIAHPWPWDAVASIVAWGILAFGGSFALQWLLIGLRETSNRVSLCSSRITRAGGVVFREQGDEVRYLICDVNE